MLTQSMLSQDDIDHLIGSLSSDTDVIELPKIASQEVMAKYKELGFAKKRLHWSRENQSYPDILAAERYLKEAAFSLWLANRNMNRQDFKAMVKRESNKIIQKR